MSTPGKLRRRLEKMKERVGGLIDRIRRLEEEKEQWEREREKLKEEVEHWKRETDHWKRQCHRQAAPFRRRDSRKVPGEKKKKPGRAPGHAGRYRPLPPEVDEDLEVGLKQCPGCGGQVEDLRKIEQYIEELPVSRPRVSRIVTFRGHCSRCGTVQSRHPDQVSTACGAARVQLGPRALAIAAQLNKEHGMSMRKTCRVLQDVCGLKITPGGLSQALDRTAERLQPAHQQLCRRLRRSAAVYADETSWWVGQSGWWLWVLADPKTILYRVEDHRSARIVEQLLGSEFSGVLVSDCLSTYNTLPYRQHKCIAHHLKAISKAAEDAEGKAADYLHEWKQFFGSVLAAHQLGVEEPAQLSADLRARFQRWCRRLLDHPVQHPAALSVHQRLHKQHPHLLRCLDDVAIEPTNNRAERSLRPAVIARKISCGNKTVNGKRTWEILASLTATYRIRGLDFVDSVTPYLTLHPPNPPPR